MSQVQMLCELGFEDRRLVAEMFVACHGDIEQTAERLFDGQIARPAPSRRLHYTPEPEPDEDFEPEPEPDQHFEPEPEPEPDKDFEPEPEPDEYFEPEPEPDDSSPSAHECDNKKSHEQAGKADEEIVEHMSAADAAAEQDIAKLRQQFGVHDKTTVDAMFRLCQRRVDAETEFDNIPARWNSSKEAIDMAKQVLYGRREGLGREHPDTLAALRLLIVCHNRNSGEGQAAVLFEELVETLEQVHGAEHMETQKAQLEYAQFLCHLPLTDPADVDCGLDLAESVMTARQRELGADHPDTRAAVRIYSECEEQVKLSKGLFCGEDLETHEASGAPLCSVCKHYHFQGSKCDQCGHVGGAAGLPQLQHIPYAMTTTQQGFSMQQPHAEHRFFDPCVPTQLSVTAAHSNQMVDGGEQGGSGQALRSRSIAGRNALRDARIRSRRQASRSHVRRLRQGRTIGGRRSAFRPGRGASLTAAEPHGARAGVGRQLRAGARAGRLV